MAPLVTISQGKIGYIFARDGKQLNPAQVLASNATVQDFQDVEGFLKNGGQRGPQRRILREGTYAFNLVEFIVITEERVYALSLSREEADTIRGMAEVIGQRNGFRPVVIKDTDDMVGIVTVHDGPSLVQGEIIAPIVGMHPHRPRPTIIVSKIPITSWRRRHARRQLQVLVEGTYYINRLVCHR